jgi:Fe-S-cluster containining protein
MDPCDGCAADCCRRFDVVIQGWDAWRIARDLRLPLAAFLAVEAAPAPDLDHQLVLDGAAASHSYHRLALKKSAGACVFLLSAGGVGRCGIYGSRPSACRAYPALSDRPRGELLQLTKREYCPPGAWDAIDRPLYAERFRFGLRQRWIHDVVGDGWNERVLRRRESRSVDDLLRFVTEVYDLLVARQPAWFAEAPLAVDADEIRARVAELLTAIGWL